LIRCNIVALAAERYRRQKGDWPTTIDQLVETGLMTAIPLDPFDGNPMKWRRWNSGWMVYSIGEDKTDDGGKYDSSMKGNGGTDIVVPLFDPNKRRLPPIAKP